MMCFLSNQRLINFLGCLLFIISLICVDLATLVFKKDLYEKEQEENLEIIDTPNIKTIKQLEDYLPVMEMELNDNVREACDDLVAPGSAAANFYNSAPWMKMQHPPRRSRRERSGQWHLRQAQRSID